MTPTLAYDAMIFAHEIHHTQRRKYTNNPYTDHLSEVAGLVTTVRNDPVTVAVAWLHDSMEDQGILFWDLYERFGMEVAMGVQFLTDVEKGNRATRKALACHRLAAAPDWVQDIKCCDLKSNKSSIQMHDPKFAVTFLKECDAALDAMTKADSRLKELVRKAVYLPE
jgi:GTP diphosphokinase / guanosine-3',5'-bis(diphosphate) 3'-diphosphatase